MNKLSFEVSYPSTAAPAATFVAIQALGTIITPAQFNFDVRLASIDCLVRKTDGALNQQSFLQGIITVNAGIASVALQDTRPAECSPGGAPIVDSPGVAQRPFCIEFPRVLFENLILTRNQVFFINAIAINNVAGNFAPATDQILAGFCFNFERL